MLVYQRVGQSHVNPFTTSSSIGSSATASSLTRAPQREHDELAPLSVTALGPARHGQWVGGNARFDLTVKKWWFHGAFNDSKGILTIKHGDLIRL